MSKAEPHLTISRLGPGDTARARANCALFWDMQHAAQNLWEFLQDPCCILLVAEADGSPVGQIAGYILKRWDARNPQLFLYSIDVVESHRRQGIARRLILAFQAIGADAGCADMFVFTNASNTTAIRLYQALGGIRTNPDDVMYEWAELTAHDHST